MLSQNQPLIRWKLYGVNRGIATGIDQIKSLSEEESGLEAKAEEQGTTRYTVCSGSRYVTKHTLSNPNRTPKVHQL